MSTELDKLSDSRIAQLANWAQDEEPESLMSSTATNFRDTRLALEELLTRRASLPADDGEGVRVEPLKWQHFPKIGENGSPEQWFAHLPEGGSVTVTFEPDYDLPWIPRPYPPGASNYATADEAKAAFEADRTKRILSALTPLPKSPEPEGVGEDWRDDLASDERWNAGVDYAITQLCNILDVDPKSISWDAATETLDGDVRAVICNAIRGAYGDEWSSKAATTEAIRAMLSAAPRPVADAGGEPVAWRRLVKNLPAIIEDHVCGGSDTRPVIDVDGLVGALTENVMAIALPPSRDDELREAFDKWWSEDGQFIDPDTSDVPWFDKRRGLAEYAFNAGRKA